MKALWLQYYLWCDYFLNMFLAALSVCSGPVWYAEFQEIQPHSRKLLMMDILMSETCWAHKKWNKIASDIKLVFYSSTSAMMHGPINIGLKLRYFIQVLCKFCRVAWQGTNYELSEDDTVVSKHVGGVW